LDDQEDKQKRFSFVLREPPFGLPWIEMYFAEDYEKAKQFIYPAILGMEGVKQAA
jgi:choline kinase